MEKETKMTRKKIALLEVGCIAQGEKARGGGNREGGPRSRFLGRWGRCDLMDLKHVGVGGGGVGERGTTVRMG